MLVNLLPSVDLTFVTKWHKTVVQYTNGNKQDLFSSLNKYFCADN